MRSFEKWVFFLLLSRMEEGGEEAKNFLRVNKMCMCTKIAQLDKKAIRPLKEGPKALKPSDKQI